MRDDQFETIESVVRSYCLDAPAVFVGGKNARLWDTEGNTWIDMMSCAGALNYGHANPDITEAIETWLTSGGLWQSLDFQTREKQTFLSEFQRLILDKRGMDYRVQFCGPTGTNAVEAAIKLARKVTGRAEIACFTNGFHGMTLGALAMTGAKAKRAGAGVPLGTTQRLPFDGYFGETIDTMSLIERFYDDPSSGYAAPAAFLVETLQGEGGLSSCSARWMRRLADLAQRLGSLLIIDDIQAGVGRCGDFFSFEAFGITPDIVCLSKSIGAGFPMSIVLIQPKHDIWAPGEHNGTFRGNNIAFVAATRALQMYWSTPQLTSTVQNHATTLSKALEAAAIQWSSMILRKKGRGCFQGLEFRHPTVARTVKLALYRRGVLAETSGPRDEVLKLMPPLTIEQETLEAGLATLDGVLLEVSPGSLKGAA